jgi:hypothetical protein
MTRKHSGEPICYADEKGKYILEKPSRAATLVAEELGHIAFAHEDKRWWIKVDDEWARIEEQDVLKHIIEVINERGAEQCGYTIGYPKGIMSFLKIHLPKPSVRRTA